MIVIDCEQGSPEWHAARAGKVTASRIANLVRNVANGKPSAMRATYMAELVAERLTGSQEPGFTSADMQHGKDFEDEAARNYAFIHGVDVTPVGFVIHPTIEMSGCSPDRLVGSDGLLQIKCPTTKVHIASLLGSRIEPDYVKQMQWELECTGRAWCDFVSYDPRMPVDMQLHVMRVERDETEIARLRSAVVDFLGELDGMVETLVSKFRSEAA